MSEKKVPIGCPSGQSRKRVDEMSPCSAKWLIRPYCICGLCDVPIPPGGRKIGVTDEDNKKVETRIIYQKLGDN